MLNLQQIVILSDSLSTDSIYQHVIFRQPFLILCVLLGVARWCCSLLINCFLELQIGTQVHNSHRRQGPRREKKRTREEIITMYHGVKRSSGLHLFKFEQTDDFLFISKTVHPLISVGRSVLWPLLWRVVIEENVVPAVLPGNWGLYSCCRLALTTRIL